MFKIVKIYIGILGQRMTLTSSNLKSSCTHIFKPKSSKLSMKFYELPFSHICLCPPKRLRSTQGHHLTNLGSTLVPDATFQGPRSLVLKKDFKGFYHIWSGCPSWSYDQTHLYKFSCPFSHKLSYDLSFQTSQLILRKKNFDFEI